MNPTAETLLNTSARDVIGLVVTFRSPKSKRIRKGKIRGISATGVRVATLDGDPFLLLWEHLISVVGGEG